MEPRISPSRPVPTTTETQELTAEEAGSIRRRMKALDDDGLRRVVGIDAEQYRVGALEIAWDEVRARGLPIDPAQAEAERRAHVRPLSLHWMWAYMGLTAVGTFAQILMAPETARTRGTGALAAVLVGALVMVVLIAGLATRRRWALWLNDVWLILGAVPYGLSGEWFTGLAYLFLWAIPNVLYFHRRRDLFGR